jgi:hypothetical protein
MSDLRVTRRGWAALVLSTLLLSFAFNWAIAGKNLACDWRTGPTSCAVVAGP